jgi:hypothetical protein
MLAIYEDPEIDKEPSRNWHNKRPLTTDRERDMFAIRENNFPGTRYPAALGSGADPKCRYCGGANETANHLAAGCSKKFGFTHYLRRHDNVARRIYYAIMEKCGGKRPQNWFRVTPAESWTSPDGQDNLYWDKLWNFPIAEKKPDIVWERSEPREVLVIEVAAPDDASVNNRSDQKVRKYQRKFEARMKKRKKKACMTIPIVVGATGVVPKKLKESLKRLQIEDRVDVTDMQKSVTMDAVEIVRTLAQGYAG